MKFQIKRLWFMIVAIIILVAASWYGYRYWQESSVDTDALWSKAVNQMTAWDSYRYTLTTEFTLDNYRQAETKINGTCDIEGNLHIYGEIMDTDLEIYQFGDVYYRQNTSTDKDSDWIILENSPLPNNEILLMELYPKQYLLPIDGTVEFIEKEKVDGIMEYRYHVTNEGNQTVAADYLTDFAYDITINGETGEIQQADVTARSKSNPSGRWKLHVVFQEVNTAIKLEAPQP